MGEPADEPTLTVADLDAALDRLAAASGAGSVGDARARSCASSPARATEREQDFLGRVLLGELRTGALEGVLTDAIARAADRPGDVGAPRGDAVGRPRRDRAARAHRHRRRARRGRPRRRPPGAADARGHGRRAPAEARRDGRARHPSNTSSTARASRCTAPATRCASSPATSPTSPTGCPRSSRSCGAMPVHDVILDGETLSLDEDGGPRPFQDTMSRFGAEARARDAAASVVLRRAARRRARPDRRAARRAARRARAHRGRAPHPRRGHRRPRGRRARLARRARRRARGRRGQGDRLAVRGRAARRRAGSRSSRCTPTTSSCSPPSGAPGGAPAGCRTCTSARSTRPASSASRAGSSWSARPSRA